MSRLRLESFELKYHICDIISRMTDPLKDKDQGAPSGVSPAANPGIVNDTNSVTLSGTERLGNVNVLPPVNVLPGTEKLIKVEKQPGDEISVPELDQSAERAFEAPPIAETERKETITSAPSITVQTSVQKETITSAGPAKTYIVSQSELAGKTPDKDSIVGLFKVEEFEEDKAERMEKELEEAA